MENGEETKTSTYGKRPLWQWILLYVIVAIVVYGLFYYFVLAKKGTNTYNPTGTSQQSVSPTLAPTSVPTTAVTSAMTSEKITVEGNEFAFTPPKITLKKGQEAVITFKNTGKYPHNLTISDLNVATKTIQPGEQDSITFTPNKTGSFSYACTVDSHAGKGMKGILTVK